MKVRSANFKKPMAAVGLVVIGLGACPSNQLRGHML